MIAARCLRGVEPLSASLYRVHGVHLFSMASMNVTVLLFASYADAVGSHSIALDLAPGATAGDVISHVRALPGAGRLPPNPLIAVNERYAKRDRVLAAGDEVAIIPPVAGG